MGRRPTKLTDEQIIASYKQTHSTYATARELKINPKTVARALFLGGVRATGLEHWRATVTKFKGQETKLRKAYESGMTIKQIAAKFGQPSALYAVKQALKRAGTELRENPAPPVQDSEVKTVRQMYASGHSQQQIAFLLDRSQTVISRIMREHNIKARIGQKGETHPNWQGGRYVSGGYVRTYIDGDDPMAVMALNDGTVLEHRLVMARTLGRPLTRRETVHHKDGDRTNNDPANLQLRNGKHGKGVRMCCLNCGSYNISASELD
jgi:transposase-like protein